MARWSKKPSGHLVLFFFSEQSALPVEHLLGQVVHVQGRHLLGLVVHLQGGHVLGLVVHLQGRQGEGIRHVPEMIPTLKFPVNSQNVT